jgi:DNA-binding Lrp family transcriptional regulator
MKKLDDQEKQIIRALVRNPRYSDNKISALTGVPVRTVSRKRTRLEEEGVLSYNTVVEMQPSGTGRFTAQHLLVIKFKLGITRSQIVQEIGSEPNVVNVFYELIRYSFIAETDGHIALVMIVEGESDSAIAENVQGKIIPSLQKNHGAESIVELHTIRLLDPIRREHNYLPLVNMEKGFIKKDWPDAAIFAE